MPKIYDMFGVCGIIFAIDLKPTIALRLTCITIKHVQIDQNNII